MDNRREFRSLLPFFFLSGMAGLIYELSWIRESAQVFGATLPALSTVTAIFFGGMALGNSRMSRKNARYSGKTLARTEFSIAVSSLLSILLFVLFRKVTPAIYPLLNDSELLLTIYRFFAIALTIGVPTFFIGMTLPLMIAITPTETGSEGETTGTVNGINALGAVTGTAIAGFLLIPHIGMTGAVITAALLNIIVGLNFLRISKSEQVVEQPENSSPIKLFPAVPLFFAIGFCGMTSQMIWSRFLALIIHNTVYTYTITLIAVIAGIAIGSFISGKSSKKEQDFNKQFGILTLLNLTTFLIAIYLPAFFWGQIGLIHSEILKTSIIAVIMFIPSLFSGAAFPIALKMVGGGHEIRGRIAGLLSASNTFGGILGSLLAGFVLLPLIGISGAATITAITLLLLVVIAFLQATRVRAAWMLLLIPLIFAALFYRTPKEFIRDYLVKPGERAEFIKEGTLSTVAVKTNGTVSVMEIDRLWQGESRKNRQIMAAHIPMLLSTNVKKALVIGIGPGETAKRFTLYNVDSLDLVDLEPAVFTAAKRYFDGSWMSSKGVRTIATDGRNYVMNTKRTYDLISIEIGQVFRPHAAGFYSEEFYRGVSNRLTENGVVGQFIPIAAFSEDAFRRAIASFIAVFPNAQLWYNSSEFILVGFKGKEKTLFNKNVAKLLRKGTPVYDDLAFNYWGGELFNLNIVDNLAASFLVGSEDLKRMVGSAKPYHDGIPELEYATAASQENPPFLGYVMQFLTPIEQIHPQASMVSIRSTELVRRANLDNIIAEELILEYQTAGDVALLNKAIEYNDKNIQAHRLLAAYYWQTEDFDSAEKELIRVFSQDPAATDVGYQIATVRLKKEDYQGAIDILYEMLTTNPGDVKANVLMGATLTQMGNFGLARHHLELALRADPTNSEALRNMDFLNSQNQESK